MKPRIRLASSVFWRNAGWWAWYCSDGHTSGLGHTPAEAYQSWEFNRILQGWGGLKQQNLRKPMPYAPFIQMGE